MPGIFWKGDGKGKEVHLTFDDGPIPEVTPWVLDLLKEYNQKATFFCVGDNVGKYPEIFRRIVEEGHGTGNHTFHHLNGWNTGSHDYLTDVGKAAAIIPSGLFRPPYGKMKLRQYFLIRKAYKIVLWTYLSGDYDKNFDVFRCLEEIKTCSKDGAVLVFHDNVKTRQNLKKILPDVLEFYKNENIRSTCIAS